MAGPPQVTVSIQTLIELAVRALASHHRPSGRSSASRYRFAYPHRGLGGAFDSESVLKAWEHFPTSVLRADRNRRQHLSGVLARNEVNRDYAYNRALFMRVSHGYYLLSPTLEVRRRQPEGESRVPVSLALNLPLIKEFVVEYYKPALERYLGGAAGQAPRPAEPPCERAEASGRRSDSSTQAAVCVEEGSELEEKALRQMLEVAPDEPKWGTPEARLREMARLQLRINQQRGRKKQG